MSLSCECHYDTNWYYNIYEDYTTLQTKRRRRCYSCKKLIDIGATVVELHCERQPKDWIEQKIYWDELVPMPTKYFCEECGDIYYSLHELGFCMELTDGESMQDLLKQYQEEYGVSNNAR